MQITIKTLLSQGKSERHISRELGISRKVVRRVKKELAEGLPAGRYQRDKILSAYDAEIQELLAQGLSARLIHDRLVSRHGLSISYSTAQRYVKSLRSSEVYVPLAAVVGEEAQVDFGYAGYFEKEGKQVKVWVFCMLLSYSRYAYYEVVLDQEVNTFLRCHQHAFEYFGGVPQLVKLDNLKAGVTKPDFYEPLIQTQYAAFLAHYSCGAVTARVRRPEDKGKVESGIKYVKNNFFKGLEHRKWDRLGKDLASWTQQKCNQRLHGTTRKVPSVVFDQEEKQSLQSLPPARFEIYRIETRKVNRMGHINFLSNYYSVPHVYAGQMIRTESNGRLLRVFVEQQEVALHQLAQGKGQYITLDQHKPPGKRQKDWQYYLEKIKPIGSSAQAFAQTIYEQVPNHWRDKCRGLISLRRKYDDLLIDKACQRALQYQALTYLAVKNICEKGLVETTPHDVLPQHMGGFGHDLKQYDHLTQ